MVLLLSAAQLLWLQHADRTDHLCAEEQPVSLGQQLIHHSNEGGTEWGWASYPGWWVGVNMAHQGDQHFKQDLRKAHGVS